MPTRNVVLTDHQADLVEQLVKSGRYQYASEVLREWLRLVENREAEEASRLEALRSAVNIGVDDIKAGRFKTFGSTGALRIHVKSLTAKVISESNSADLPNRSGVTGLNFHFRLENGEIWAGAFSQKVVQTIQELILSAGLPSYEEKLTP